MKTTSAPVAATEEVVPFSIRLLRRLDPVISAVLQSPLHALLSRDVLLLTYRGRKTGQPHRLPLSYVEIDDHLYLCTRTSRWWRNLGEGRRVDLRLRGRRRQAESHVLPAGTDEALAGLRAFLTRNPRTAETLYDVACDAERRPLEADLKREVRRSIVIRLDLLPA